MDGFLPCIWIRDDLCSACSTVGELLESPEGRPWLAAIVINDLEEVVAAARELAASETLIPIVDDKPGLILPG